jgi:hypothetical protein
MRGKALMGIAASIVIDKSRVAGTAKKKYMKRINFPVTIEELRLLASLASDQLFRRQFIDPRMPGYKGSPEEVDLGKALVGRMRLIIDGDVRHPTSALAQSSSSRERGIL